MANHFRSSEGQDGTSPVQQPGHTNSYAPQPAAIPSFDEASQQAAPQQPAYSVPTTALDDQQAASHFATAVPSVPGVSSVPDVTSVPSVASVPDVNDEPAAGGVSAFADSADDYDASEEAGFTTAFAPITKEADTRSVNSGGVPTISFQGVSMVYPAQPNKPALDSVDVDVYAGEFVFLVGHSGSGKSTFLKLITRELKPTHGRVLVAGQDLTAMRNWKVPYLRRQIGCVFQDFKLLPDKTIFDNVAFALECIGKPRSVIKAQVPEVLRLVGLGEKMDVYPDQLSGGEQQRVSVARAMVNRPPLLVCDEPTGNLDPAISLGIMKLLERINRTGTTVLMATHDREMVDSMRKRVIALEAGHVVRDQERGGYGYYGAI